MTVEVKLVDYKNEKQAQELIYLLNEYALDPMGGAEPLSDKVKNNLVDTMAKVGNVFSVIVYVDGKPVGLTNCVVGFSTFACKPLVNIHDCVVLDGNRGKGIAKKMLSFIEGHAKDMGACKLTLEVLEGNTRARQVYQSYGFSDYQLDPEMGNALFWQKYI